MTETLLDRTLTARAEEVSGVVTDVGELARRVGLPPDRALKVELAVEEAAVNICNHAYDDSPGPLRVRALNVSDSFIVEISDTGRPFNPLKQTPPDLSGDLMQRPIGGVGIHLIRSVAADVRYARGGNWNILTLTFHLTA